MQKILLSLLLSVFSLLYLHAQVPTGLPAAAQAKAQQAGPSIAWQRCYGGSNYDWFNNAISTSDSGILASAMFLSTDGDLEGETVASGWIMKFDSNFNIEWEKNYNTDLDICKFYFTELIELKNGHFILAGSGAGDDCPEYNGGEGDIALAEIDKSGNIIWYNLYGGNIGGDGLSSFMQTQDGGYLITAYSTGSGGDIPFHYEGGMGTTDAILIKTDSIGNLVWLKVFGGSNYDSFLGDPTEISRGIYILSIGTVSDDYDLEDSPISGPKRWIVKIDSTGEIIQEHFMSPDIDLSNSDGQTDIIKENYTPTGKGWAGSSLYTTYPEHSGEEGAIAFFDTASLELVGLRQWGGTGYDQLVKHVRDEYRNFYFLGFSTSADGDLPGNYNTGETSDYWLMATDSNFNLLWSRNFGGSDDCGDLGCSNFDGNLVYSNNMLYAFVKSTTDIIPDYDIECGHPSLDVNFGFTDAWLVAFDLSTALPDNLVEENSIKIFPNPAFEIISIEYDNTNFRQLDIQICDLQNRIVATKNILNDEPLQVDVKQLQNGMYFIKIYADNTLVQTSKIIIQNP